MRTLLRFLGLTFQPIRKVGAAVAVGQIVGLPSLIVLVSYFVGVARLGALQGVVIGLGCLTSLFAIAGLRLQRAKDQASELNVSITPLTPGRYSHPSLTGGHDSWSQGALIENRGPGSRFRVHTVSHFAGLEVDTYGSGVALAWEQSESNEHHLSRDEAGNLKFFISFVDASGRRYLRLWIPPSAYGAGFGLGTLLVVTDESVRFRLRITDVDRDRSKMFQTEIRLAGNDAPPSLTFTPTT